MAVLTATGCTGSGAGGTPSTNSWTDHTYAVAQGKANASDIRAAISDTVASARTARVQSKTELTLESSTGQGPELHEQPKVNTTIEGISTLDGAFADLIVDLGLPRTKPVKVALRGGTAWVKSGTGSEWAEAPELAGARDSVTVSGALSYFPDENPLSYEGTSTTDGQEAHKYTTRGVVTPAVALALIGSGALPATGETIPERQDYTASIWISAEGYVVRVEATVPVLDILKKLAPDTPGLDAITQAATKHTLRLWDLDVNPAPTETPTEKTGSS